MWVARDQPSTITEAQLDLQRKFITERLESLRARPDDYRAREASGAEKRALMETVLAWAGEVGEGLDDLTPEQRMDQGAAGDLLGLTDQDVGDEAAGIAGDGQRRAARWPP